MGDRVRERMRAIKVMQILVRKRYFAAQRWCYWFCHSVKCVVCITFIHNFVRNEEMEEPKGANEEEKNKDDEMVPLRSTVV